MSELSGSSESSEPSGSPDRAAVEEEDASFFARREAGDEPSPRAIETWSALLLAITVILTAWSGFEASKWGGAMSIAFSEASSARVQANRAEGDADSDRQVDLSIYSLWLETRAAGENKASAYVEERFTPWFKPAFDEWVAQGGISDPDNAPKSPFAVDAYVLPGLAEVQELDARADERFAQALVNNQRGDNYTILGVLFATVLFFAAISTRFANRRLQYGMLTFATIAFGIGIAFLISFPKLI